MKICHVITRLIIGGAQENTILTCRGLVERGHEVILAAGSETGPEGSLWDAARACGARLIPLQHMRRAVGLMVDWKARPELIELFRREQPDVVHTHSSKAGILGRSAAYAARAPRIVHTIHGMSFNRTQPAAVRATYRWLERKAGRYTDAFITVADAMIDQSVAAGLGLRERFTTIRSGLDTSLFAPSPSERERYRQAWGINDDEVVVGTVARLFQNKGYDEILAAMPAMIAGCPRLRFVWVGDGKHRARYESRLERLGLRSRVRLLGLVAPDQVASILHGFDIILHASRWEGLPRAIVQGLLSGLPAVSFDNDGAPEVVIHGETGFLAPYGDTACMAAGVVALARDTRLRQRLGAAGRARCLTEFEWRRMAEAIEAVYLRLSPAR